MPFFTIVIHCPGYQWGQVPLEIWPSMVMDITFGHDIDVKCNFLGENWCTTAYTVSYSVWVYCVVAVLGQVFRIVM